MKADREKAVLEKIELWDREVGKILVEPEFERWTEINAPLILAPFFPDRITPLDHSDITFAVEWSSEEGLNLQRFAVGAFYPEKTRPFFTSFLIKKAGQEGLVWFENTLKGLNAEVVSLGIGVDGKRKEWRFYVQSNDPERAVLGLTVSFDGEVREEKVYSYNPLSLMVVKGERGERRQINILSEREQEIALSFIQMISPRLYKEVFRILELGFSLDTISVHPSKERVVLYFEPLILK